MEDLQQCQNHINNLIISTVRVVAAIFKPENIDLRFCVVVCDINYLLAARQT